MKQIVAIGASSSSTSINRVFATYAASQIQESCLTVLDLNDYEMPIYSSDRENESGVPQKALHFIEELGKADGIVLSLAEHNGAYSVAFKNILDWASRAREQMDVWQNKPMLLLATSPGGRGGASVYSLAENYFPHMAAQIIAGMKLPKYYDNFDVEQGISDGVLRTEFESVLAKFQSAVDADNEELL